MHSEYSEYIHMVRYSIEARIMSKLYYWTANERSRECECVSVSV